MPEPTLMESEKTKQRYANKDEFVPFVATDNCTVSFDQLNIKLELKKGTVTSIAFSKDGTYSFKTLFKAGSRGQCDPTSPIIVPRQ